MDGVYGDQWLHAHTTVQRETEEHDVKDQVTLQLLIEIHHRWFHQARRHGGACGQCGRALNDGETVWLERLQVPGDHRSSLRVPVGIECVSAAFREQTKGEKPEQCSWCGRGVFYPRTRNGQVARHTRALCSRRCGSQASVGDQQKCRETITNSAEQGRQARF